MIQDPLVSSTLDIKGYEITEQMGIVQGIVVRSRSVVGNFFGSIQSIFGGNITIYTELCEHAREDAYYKMIQDAKIKGANAIVGFRYDTTEIDMGLTEVIAYGTAVKVVEKQ